MENFLKIDMKPEKNMDPISFLTRVEDLEVGSFDLTNLGRVKLINNIIIVREFSNLIIKTGVV